MSEIDSNHPLDETIRASRKQAEADRLKALQEDWRWLVSMEKPVLTLIDTKYLGVDAINFDAVGFGTCHIQGPDGKLQLVSVSVVAAKADQPGHDVMLARAKALSNELFGLGIEYKDGAGRPWLDGAKSVSSSGLGQYADDSDAYRAAYSQTLMGQYENLQDAAHHLGTALAKDWDDLKAIVRGWFKR